jgi:hypothetical protein
VTSRAFIASQVKRNGNTLHGLEHMGVGGLVMQTPTSTALHGTLETLEESRAKWVKKMQTHGASTTWQETWPNGVLMAT